MPTVNVLVKGRVQGVFYRQSTRETASALGLSGWVRNLRDGRVEIEASGPREQLVKLLAWCNEGPPHAMVGSVEVEWLDESSDSNRHQDGFHIK
jgi:acylphosphatase